MRGKNLLISLALHALALALLLWLSRSDAQHRAIAIAVVEGAQKKPEPKPEPPKPPPPPPPAPRPRRLEPAPEVSAPAPAPAPTPAPAPRPAALSTGLTLDNGAGGNGGGLAVGGMTHGPVAHGDPKTSAPRREPVKPPPPPPDEDACTESPTKPVPLVRTTDIEYTAQARADGVEGRLVLSVIVAADGSVLRVEVVSAVEAALDAAAVAAVSTWRFKPATACGKPVSGGVFMLARRFELGD
ncbi:MAG: energy transducer TonB [Archangium sp.]